MSGLPNTKTSSAHTQRVLRLKEMVYFLSLLIFLGNYRYLSIVACTSVNE